MHRTVPKRQQSGEGFGFMDKDSKVAPEAQYERLVNDTASCDTVQAPRDPLVKRIVASGWFKFCSILCLVIALFGGGTMILIDYPDEDSLSQADAVMTSISVFFILEIVLRSMAESWEYMLTFFFWMDIIGVLSMTFEISYMFGAQGKIRDSKTTFHPITVQSARAARIGARAGRLSRPLRLLNHLLKGDALDTQEAGYSAKVLGARLTLFFSSKVAMLTVALVLGVPLFNIGRYPEDDFSMRSWGYKLEADYERDFKLIAGGSQGDAHTFRDAVIDMRDFYHGLGLYIPFQLEGYPVHVNADGIKGTIPGENLLRSPAPNRKQNILKQEVTSCRVSRAGCDGNQAASIYFDFTASAMSDAKLDMALIVFIVLCMLIESLDMSYSVDRMMVQPMVRMLDAARVMAMQLNETLSKGTVAGPNSDAVKAMTQELGYMARENTDDHEICTEDEVLNEIDMLQGLFKKVVFLISLFMEQDEEEETTAPSPLPIRFSRGAEDGPVRLASALASASIGLDSVGVPPSPSNRYIRPKLEPTSEEIVAVSWSDSHGPELWSFNAGDLSVPRRKALCEYVLFKSEIGTTTGKMWIDESAFDEFYRALSGVYNDKLRYHNFQHACNVLASLYRWLIVLQWSSWLGDLDATALLIAAMGIDADHPGRTNSFLVEQSSPLALRHNDKSPLENHHCAQLFEVLRDANGNVFKRMDQVSLKQSRSVIIEAILNTNTENAPRLIKEIRKVYGMSSEMCDTQALHPESLANQYISDVLVKNGHVFRKSLLYLADVSHSFQPFKVCRLIAQQLVEESFLQGDEERKLGLPVGAMHDRTTVTVAGSQFGFITLLLSPLALGIVHIFPMTSPVCKTMIENLKEWHNEMMKEPSFNAEVGQQQIQKTMAQYEKFLSNQLPRISITPHMMKVMSRGLDGSGGINLAGKWTCVSTWGLEEFLKSSGVSWARRKAAMSAPWPTWEFQQSGDHIVFTNHSALGALREEMTANGTPYSMLDGWKQTVNSKAWWDNKSLMIERVSPQGKFREERSIDESGKLHFRLTPLEPNHPAWGRTFQLAKTKKK